MNLYVCVCSLTHSHLSWLWIGRHTHARTETETLVPLTSSLYVPGKIGSSDRVIVDIGTGYYVKKVNCDDEEAMWGDDDDARCTNASLFVLHTRTIM